MIAKDAMVLLFDTPAKAAAAIHLYTKSTNPPYELVATIETDEFQAACFIEAPFPQGDGGAPDWQQVEPNVPMAGKRVQVVMFGRK